ncbi:MAG: PepSY-associated TM helix domain-containing protein [Alphaproteobacteria bacterium]
MSEAARVRKPRSQRAFWLKELYRWHWISAGLSLVGMLLFAITGITLNHAADIEARPVVASKEAPLPPGLAAVLSAGAAGRDKGPLPPAVSRFLYSQWRIDAGGQAAEWSDDEVYVPLPRPGGDAWVSFRIKEGTVLYETTDRGWISYFNDLHKGRHTGAAWNWFIDLFAVCCLVFCITGVCLLQIHAAKRPATWPVVGLGLIAPVLLALLFIH